MAADGWQEEYSTCLIKLWFRQGIASPDLFTEMTSRQQLHVKIWIGLKALSAKMHEKAELSTASSVGPTQVLSTKLIQGKLKD